MSRYVVMLCFIILAPIGLALADYILVGKLIRYAGRRFSLVDPRFVEWAFITSDIISIAVQAGGAVLLSDTNPDKITTGSNVLIAGLAFNLCSFTLFAIVTGYLDWRVRQQMRQTNTVENAEANAFVQGDHLRAMFYALYASILLLIIRSIYRIVEFSTGFLGYVATHEAFFHVFDTLPIAVAFCLFVVIHPGRFMPKRTASFMENMNIQPDISVEKPNLEMKQ